MFLLTLTILSVSVSCVHAGDNLREDRLSEGRRNRYAQRSVRCWRVHSGEMARTGHGRKTSIGAYNCIDVSWFTYSCSPPSLFVQSKLAVEAFNMPSGQKTSKVSVLLVSIIHEDVRTDSIRLPNENLENVPSSHSTVSLHMPVFYAMLRNSHAYYI